VGEELFELENLSREAVPPCAWEKDRVAARAAILFPGASVRAWEKKVSRVLDPLCPPRVGGGFGNSGRPSGISGASLRAWEEGLCK
jgi:hypothetical protein